MTNQNLNRRHSRESGNPVFKLFFEGMFKAWIPASAGMTMLLSLIPAWAADPGKTAGLTLTRTYGARPAALGEAFAAVNGDINSIAFNPAGLASLPEPQLSAIY